MSTRERRIVVIGQRREELDLRALADLIVAAAEADPASHGENDVVSEPRKIQRTPAPGKGGPEKIARRRP
jgi:hypothetical protein